MRCVTIKSRHSTNRTSNKKKKNRIFSNTFATFCYILTFHLYKIIPLRTAKLSTISFFPLYLNHFIKFRLKNTSMRQLIYAYNYTDMRVYFIIEKIESRHKKKKLKTHVYKMILPFKCNISLFEEIHCVLAKICVSHLHWFR